MTRKSKSRKRKFGSDDIDKLDFSSLKKVFELYANNKISNKEEHYPSIGYPQPDTDTGYVWKLWDEKLFDTIIGGITEKYQEIGNKDFKEKVYIQKIELKQDEKVIIIGDLHSSLISLIQILGKLVDDDIIKDNFEFEKKNYKMIFLGDIVDRGPYSIELLLLAFKLKIKNPDNVFIINGNHEDEDVYYTYGLGTEIKKELGDKIKEENKKLKGEEPNQEVLKRIDGIENILKLLPSAIFLKYKGDKKWFQLCHGGIEANFNPKKALEKDKENFVNIHITKDGNKYCTYLDEESCPKKYKGESSRGYSYVDDKIKEFDTEYIEEYYNYNGLKWADFDKSETGFEGSGFDYTSGRSWVYGPKATKEYLDNNNLHSIISGHQDNVNLAILQEKGKNIVKSEEELKKIKDGIKKKTDCKYNGKLDCIELKDKSLILNPTEDFLALITSTATGPKREFLSRDTFLILKGEEELEINSQSIKYRNWAHEGIIKIEEDKEEQIRQEEKQRIKKEKNIEKLKQSQEEKQKAKKKSEEESEKESDEESQKNMLSTNKMESDNTGDSSATNNNEEEVKKKTSTREVKELERQVKKKQLKKQLKELEEQEKKEEQEALFERAKKVEKYFPKGNIPEDVNEEQVVEAEEKAKKEKEKAKKKEEEKAAETEKKYKTKIEKFKENNKLDNNTNENEVKGYASTKIQRLFRGNKGRKIFQDEKQHKEQETTLEELQKDFPQSKEATLSFSGIDKVNTKLKDLLDHIKKYTIEESEETEELEKQQIEAEIELTKAETSKAIKESERINKFGSISIPEGFSYYIQQFKELEEEEKKLTSNEEQNKEYLKKKEQQLKDKMKATTKIERTKLEEYGGRIKEILLGYNIESDNLEQEYIKLFNEYENIINKIIQTSDDDTVVINWDIDLKTAESKIFIEALGLLLFYKKIVLKDEENYKDKDIIIYFLSNLDFLSEDVKNLSLLNIFKVYYEDNPNIKSTNIDGRILNKGQDILKITEEILNLKRDITKIGLFITNNNKSFVKIQAIESNIVDYIKKQKEWSKQVNDDLKNQWSLYGYDDIDAKKEEVMTIFKDYNITDDDFNYHNFLRYKIATEEIDPLRKIYVASLEYFFTKIEELKKETIFDKKKELESIKFTIPEKINQSIVKFTDLDKLENNVLNFINKYVSSVEDIIQADEEEKIFKELNLKEEEGKLEVTNKELTELKLNRKNLSNKQKLILQQLIKSMSTQKMYEEENKSMQIYLNPYGYKSVDDFIDQGAEHFPTAARERFSKGLLETIRDKKLTKEMNKILEKAERVFSGNKSDEEYNNTVKGQFLEFNLELQSFIFSLIPVRTVLNFSTVVKPVGEKVAREIMEPSGIDGVMKVNGNKFTSNKTGIYKKNKAEEQIYNNDFSFTNYTENALKNTGIAYKEGNDDIKQPLEDILGKEIQLIMIQKDVNKWINTGPFYKIFHTTNDDVTKKKYDITNDISRLKKGDLDHITYAGYGFSGSGKTYTLIEGDDSILNNVIALLNKEKIEIDNIKVYEVYKERFDKKCNKECDKIIGSSTFKGPIINTLNRGGGLNKDDIVTQIKQINENRKKNKVNPEPSTDVDKKFYRTSIRRTSFNDQSSRSHMFIDIIIKDSEDKYKKITILDMAGSEKVEDIQDDYFKTNSGYEIDDKGFEEEIKNITKLIADLDANKGNGGMLYTFFQTEIKKKYYDNVNGNKKQREYYNTQNYNVYPLYKDIVDIKTFTKEKPTYNIVKENWKILFNDEDEDGEKYISENQNTITDFLGNYNEYQYYEKLNVVKDLYNIIKKDLEEINQKNEDGIDVGNFTFIHNSFGDAPEMKIAYKNSGVVDDVTTGKNIETYIEECNKMINYIKEPEKDRILIDLKSKLTNSTDDKDKKDLQKKIVKRKEYGPLINTQSSKVRININKNQEKKMNILKINMEKSLYKHCLKQKLNNFFKETLGDSYTINNFNLIENNMLTIYKTLMEEKTHKIGYNYYNNKFITSFKVLAEIYKKFYENFNNILEVLEDYIKDNDSGDYIKNYKELGQNDIKQKINQKIEWDKNIITKYHCPLRFQGNAINDSIEEFKKNLRNKNANEGFEEGTFPIDVEKWKTVVGKNDPNREFVVFTNIRLDFEQNTGSAIANSFRDSILFASELLKEKSNFGKKKVSKKTSTRSFRKRGRRRGPSGTEIL